MVIDHDSGRNPPQALINALDEVSPDRVVILGGPVAVSQRVEDQLNEESPAGPSEARHRLSNG